MLKYKLFSVLLLFLASSSYSADLINLARQGNIEGVKLLLEKGADVNQKNERGLTALQAAAAIGQDEMVEYLLKQPGINKDQKIDPGFPFEGFNALSLALMERRETVVELLLNKGAQVNDSEGSALQIAIANIDPDSFKLLLQKGAQVKLPSQGGQTLLDMALSLEQLNPSKSIIEMFGSENNLIQYMTLYDTNQRYIEESKMEVLKLYEILRLLILNGAQVADKAADEDANFHLLMLLKKAIRQNDAELVMRIENSGVDFPALVAKLSRAEAPKVPLKSARN